MRGASIGVSEGSKPKGVVHQVARALGRRREANRGGRRDGRRRDVRQLDAGCQRREDFIAAQPQAVRTFGWLSGIGVHSGAACDTLAIHDQAKQIFDVEARGGEVPGQGALHLRPQLRLGSPRSSTGSIEPRPISRAQMRLTYALANQGLSSR